MVAFSVTFNYGTVHFTGLKKEKGDALKLAAGNFDSRMSLSLEAREDICWWLRNIRQSGQTLRRPKPHLVVFTDASNEGWGAHVGSETAGGRWTAEELSDHINVLELRAILLGLQSLCEATQKHIRIMTDNTTALAYVKHQGGVKSGECQAVAKKIWLLIAHVPGVENVLVDFHSRHFQDNLEWSLSDKILRKSS